MPASFAAPGLSWSLPGPFTGERSGNLVHERPKRSLVRQPRAGNLPSPRVVYRTQAGWGQALDEDDALIERARHGDTDAYAALVEHYQELAFRTAYVILGDAAEAEDAAQEAFINAFYALGRFRAGSPFRPWILRIVANAARNRRKSAARREHLTIRFASDELRRTHDPPELTLIHDEQRQLVLAAVGRAVA